MHALARLGGGVPKEMEPMGWGGRHYPSGQPRKKKEIRIWIGLTDWPEGIPTDPDPRRR